MTSAAPLALPALSGTLALLAKATLVVCAAGLAAASPAGRRASAATRHLVWLIAIVALLALPLLGAVLPAWRVVTLAARVSAPEAAAPAEWTGAPTGAGGPAASAAPSAAATTTAATTMETRPVESVPAAPRVPLWAWLALAYAAGVAVLLVQVALGRSEVRRLARSAVAVHDHPDWSELFRELVWMAGIDRRVTLLRSRRPTMPMTWGTLRPCILLPAEADGWSPERRRVVLLHELAHVARHDCLSQMVAGVACALYWMHPGVWYAARRLRVERELACDDRVLASGTRARAYAEHLLEVARAFHPAGRTAMVAVSMARPSHLEGRMLAVLDRMRSRNAPSARGVGIAAAACAVLLVPVAAANVGAALASDAPALLPPVAALRASTVPQEQVVERTVAAYPGGRLTVELETGGELEVVAWNQDAVSLHAELAGRDWRATRVELSTAAAGGATLRARDTSGRRSYSTSHRFRLQVPPRYDVAVQSNGGGITIRGVEGAFTGHTDGGALVLANVRGRAELSTNGGEVQVTDARLDGSLRTNGGDVRLTNVQGSVRGYTAGGEVLRLGRGDDGGSAGGTPVRIHRAGGEISVDDAPYGADLSTGGGAVSVGRARGFVNAHTGAGRVTLGSVDGDVRVSTGNGAVTVGLAGAIAGDRTVEVRSGTGDVTVSIPAGVGVDLDVETGYTPSHPQVHIVSDYAVPITQTRDYESVQGGTPRRFVRTRGRVGDGRVRVSIRTVNGSVRLRRIPAGRASTDCVGPACTFGTAEGTRLLSASFPREDGTWMDADARAAASLVRTVFATSDPRTQREATEELADLPGDAGLDGLVRIALHHPGIDARRAAASGLGRIACDESIATLTRMIDTERDGAVRQRAIEALASTIRRTDVDRHARPEDVRAILRRMAQSSADGSVRAGARKALAQDERNRT